MCFLKICAVVGLTATKIHHIVMEMSRSDRMEHHRKRVPWVMRDKGKGTPRPY